MFIGSGMHGLEGAMLERFREAVVADGPGRSLVRAIDKVKAAGSYEIGGATRKTVLRGFDASHKRARLLLHEGLYAGLEVPGDVAGRPGFGDLALRHFSATWPIGRWLLEEVAKD